MPKKPPKHAPSVGLRLETAEDPPFVLLRFEGREKAYNHGAHRHRYFELVLIESGTGFQYLEGKRVPAEPGDVFILTPGESHDPDGLNTTVHWIVAFDASFITRKFRSDESLYSTLPIEVVLLSFARPKGPAPLGLRLSEKDRKEWISRLGLAAEEFSTRGLGYVEKMQALLSIILIDLARVAAPSLPFAKGPERGNLGKFFAVLEDKFRQPTDLKKLASGIGLSPSYLTDLVKRETGKSAMEWLRSRRVSEAKILLREGTLSVKEVAFDAGYRDVGLFIRHFSREIGQSPTAWKKTQA
jgi:AraC family transcriptional activator of pobA